MVRWLESQAGNLYLVERLCFRASEAMKCWGATRLVRTHPCGDAWLHMWMTSGSDWQRQTWVTQASTRRAGDSCCREVTEEGGDADGADGVEAGGIEEYSVGREEEGVEAAGDTNEGETKERDMGCGAAMAGG
jgi:hypothetical protein